MSYPGIDTGRSGTAGSHISQENQRFLVEVTRELITAVGNRFIKPQTKPRIRILGICARGEVHDLGLLMIARRSGPISPNTRDWRILQPAAVVLLGTFDGRLLVAINPAIRDDDGIGIDTGVGFDLIQPAAVLALTFDHVPPGSSKFVRSKGSDRFVLLFGPIQLTGQ